MADPVNSSDEAVEAAIKAALAANNAFCEDHNRGAMWDPAERVTRESIERGAAAMRDAMAAPSQPWSDPDHDVMRDLRRVMAAPIDLLTSLQANLPPAPSQPVTCEHGSRRGHQYKPDHLRSWTTLPWCPGPVSVPKESSE